MAAAIALSLPRVTRIPPRALATAGVAMLAVLLAGQLSVVPPHVHDEAVVSAHEILPPLSADPIVDRGSSPADTQDGFSLTLDPPDLPGLLGSLRAAGVVDADIEAVRSVAGGWSGGESSFARVGLRLEAGGSVRITSLRLADDGGVQEWLRGDSGFEKNQDVGSTLTRVDLRPGEDGYWALRRSGIGDADASRIASAIAARLHAPGVVTLHIEDAPARFGPSTSRRVAMFSVGTGQARQRYLRSADGRWTDADRKEADGFARPVAGQITSTFGYRFHPILHFSRLHAGVDFGAAWGSPVYAAAAGTIDRAGWRGGYGRQVEIAHGGGMTSSYSHLSRIVAGAGEHVEKGDLVGFVGASGLATGPHLHFEVRRRGAPVDPMTATGGLDGGDSAGRAALRARADRIEAAS